MAFHPLGSARMDARPEPRRPRRRRPRARHGGRLRLRRQRDPVLARRQPADHDHDPRDPIGGPSMSFLIDPPWLYANGRAIARTSRPAPARRRHDGGLLGRQHPALPQRRWTRPIWRACRARERARLDAQLRRASGSTPSSPPRAPTRSARRSSRPTRCGSGSATATGAMSAPRFPAVAAHRGHYESYYLRAADPASGRSAWIRHTVFKRPGGPATGALWCTLFDAAEPEPRAVKQSLPDPRAGDWLDLGPATSARPARAAAPRRSGAARPGSSPSAPPPSRCATSPTRKLYDAPAPAHEDGEPAARHDDLGLGRGGRRALGARRLARDGRPQLGRRARRALDLAARRRLRRRARRVARRRARPRAHGPAHHAVDRQRRAAPRRRAHPPRRPRPPRARRRAPRRRHDRGQRRAHRGPRRAARLVGLLRPRPAASTAARTARSRPSS